MNFLRILLITIVLNYNLTAFSSINISLEEKIGQMIILGFKGKSTKNNTFIQKAIIEDKIGGVVLFDYDYQNKKFDNNIESPTQLLKLTTELKNLNKSNLLPLIIAIDYEGGIINRLKEKYGFPPTYSAQNIAIKDARKIFAQMAKILQNSGLNLDFAPVVDLNINPNNPIIGSKERSFSASPSEVIKFAKLFSNEFARNNIQCTYKHFPGHGSSTADSHWGFVDITNSWHKKELIPYEVLINQKNSCNFIMTAHVINKKLDKNGLPATLSYEILTNLLRKKLNFNGVIITDDLQMHAIKDNFGLKKAIRLAINAGADMLIFGNNLNDTPITAKEIIGIILNEVKSGRIKKERIEVAYNRISMIKSTLN